MPFDGARAEEEPGADLGVGQAIARQAGDLPLLTGELVARVRRSLAHLLARRQELAASALGERLHADRLEHLVCGAQLLARIHAAALAAEPFGVKQLDPGELWTQPRAAQMLARLAIEVPRGFARAQQRTRTGRLPEPPLGVL